MERCHRHALASARQPPDSIVLGGPDSSTVRSLEIEPRERRRLRRHRGRPVVVCAASWHLARHRRCARGTREAAGPHHHRHSGSDVCGARSDRRHAPAPRHAHGRMTSRSDPRRPRAISRTRRSRQDVTIGSRCRLAPWESSRHRPARASVACEDLTPVSGAPRQRQGPGSHPRARRPMATGRRARRGEQSCSRAPRPSWIRSATMPRSGRARAGRQPPDASSTGSPAAPAAQRARSRSPGRASSRAPPAANPHRLRRDDSAPLMQSA